MVGPRLAGRTALITGAGSGFGRATARRFVEEGASKIVLADIKLDSAEKVRVEIEELGADAYVYATAELAGRPQTIVVRVDGRTPPARGQRLNIAPKLQHVHLFDTETGLRLG